MPANDRSQPLPAVYHIQVWSVAGLERRDPVLQVIQAGLELFERRLRKRLFSVGSRRHRSFFFNLSGSEPDDRSHGSVSIDRLYTTTRSKDVQLQARRAEVLSRSDSGAQLPQEHGPGARSGARHGLLPEALARGSVAPDESPTPAPHIRPSE
ncbi:MAG: hypothetical protein HC884_09835 [Chloroflexaceae bacterium]|nr:hypothetical protein [Chloroflexaceae bacterium]